MTSQKIQRVGILALLVVSVSVAGLAQAAPFLPDFSAATFVRGAPVDNLFFPLLDGKTRVFEGDKIEDGEVVSERFELTTLGVGPGILGVQTTQRLDRAFEDDLLVEETLDYYAQDSAGNVWYFGEDVTNFIYDDDGNLIDTNSESAWRAGVNGALPGFIMPVDLSVGFNYYQEFAALDEALDQGTTFAVGQLVSIDFGDFSNVLQVLETSELSPDSREFKYYAPGQGLILVEEGLDEAFQNPTAVIELVSEVTEVAGPTTWSLMGIGLVGLVGCSRRKKAG